MGAFALSDLLVVNFLTVVTEFIGVAFGLGYFGVSKYVSVPLAALALIALPVTGSFRRWERAVYVFVALSLIAVPLVLLAHRVSPATVTAGVNRGPAEATMLVVIALVGTTVAPGSSSSSSPTLSTSGSPPAGFPTNGRHRDRHRPVRPRGDRHLHRLRRGV